MGHEPKWLTLSSVRYLVSAGIGTVIAIQQNLRADFGGFLAAGGGTVIHDFVTMNGTALSAPLIFLVLQGIFTVLIWRPGRVGLVSVAGLTLLGGIYTLAQLGEPIVLRILNPASFDLAQAVVLAADLMLSAAMLIFGIREWRGRRATH